MKKEARIILPNSLLNVEKLVCRNSCHVSNKVLTYKFIVANHFSIVCFPLIPLFNLSLMIHLQKISAAWKKIDTNGDNKISKAEFSTFLSFLFPEESIPQEKADDIYNSVDSNNDFQWAKIHGYAKFAVLGVFIFITYLLNQLAIVSSLCLRSHFVLWIL